MDWRAFIPGRRLSGRRRNARCVTVALAIGGMALAVRTAEPQGMSGATDRAAVLAHIRQAEDQRGRGVDGLVPLVEGIRHADPEVRRAAARGLGRQEAPEHVELLLPLLEDDRSDVRLQAMESLARALRGWAGQPAAERTRADTQLLDAVLAALRARGTSVDGGPERDAAARAIGLLPLWDQGQARRAEQALLELGGTYGLYFLARSRRALGDLTPAAITFLRRETASEEVERRRLAWLALAAAGHRNEPRVRDAIRDPDAQVRRLVVAYLPNVSDTSVWRTVLEATRRDPAVMVRLEWVRVFRQLAAANDCAPLIAALADASMSVRLAAIDALGGPCPNSPAVAAWLERVAASAPTGRIGGSGRTPAWHVRARVLVSLARLDAPRAGRLVRQDAASAVWQMRMYAARAAAILRDSATLTRLAFDTVGSVREAAITGLAADTTHASDQVFVRALQSPDHHVVLAAARALRTSPLRDALVAPLLDALDRITTEREETSRDPRLEILARIDERGDGRVASRLTPYLGDFDPAVAERAAAILNRINGSTARHVAAPRPLSIDPRPIEELRLRPATYLRVTMAPTSGGGSFLLRLHPEVAPITVARVVYLVRQGYYDRLTWHRVAPNFVIQGGSPGMNEYVGDSLFIRDELDGRSHRRGTVGISTRGRDTGDAQWFVNLVDNFRLDPDYTVFASVEQGMDVVEGILEGDEMLRVEVVTIAR